MMMTTLDKWIKKSRRSVIGIEEYGIEKSSMSTINESKIALAHMNRKIDAQETSKLTFYGSKLTNEKQRSINKDVISGGIR